MTHVVESPIQMQSIKQNLELVILQKIQNVKYFQDRKNLTFYAVDLAAHCFEACAVSVATKTAICAGAEFCAHSVCLGPLVIVCVSHIYAADSKNKKGKDELLQAPWPGGVGGARGETVA